MLRRALVAALFSLISYGANAQNQQGIVPSGSNFVPGHTIRCQNNRCTVAVDAGGAAGSSLPGQGYLTELGITNTGTPLCINDALTNAVGGYHQFCVGANSLGGGLISYNAEGGASPLPLDFEVNGVKYSFPFIIPNPLALNNYVSAAVFGAVCDGTTDDAAHINAAVAQAASQGGAMVALPAGKTCKINSPIAITTGSVGLTCISGAGNNVGTGSGCTLKGAPAIQMVTVAAPYGSTSSHRLAGNIIQGITFIGNGAAGGVYFQSVLGCKLDSNTFTGVFNSGNVLEYDIVPTYSGTGQWSTETIDTQYCLATNNTVVTTGTSNGLKLDEYFDGVGGGNASENKFINTVISTPSGTKGVWSYGGDNNTFSVLSVFTPADSIDLDIYVNGPNIYGSNGYSFDHVYWAGTFHNRGTPTVATCTPYLLGNIIVGTCPFNNAVHNVDHTNGSETFSIEAGSQLTWDDTAGNHSFTVMLNQDTGIGGGNFPSFLALAPTSAYNTCVNNALAFASGTGPISGYFCGANAGFVLDDAASHVYQQYVDGSGNLHWVQTTGTDQYVFGTVPVVINAGVIVGPSGAPTAGTNQISWGGPVVAASNCGSLASSNGCLTVNVAGTLSYVPFYHP